MIGDEDLGVIPPCRSFRTSLDGAPGRVSAGQGVYLRMGNSVREIDLKGRAANGQPQPDFFQANRASRSG